MCAGNTSLTNTYIHRVESTTVTRTKVGAEKEMKRVFKERKGRPCPLTPSTFQVSAAVYEALALGICWPGREGAMTDAYLDTPASIEVARHLCRHH